MGQPVVSLYVGDEVAWVDVHNLPVCVPLAKRFFKNGRGACDQTTEYLEELLSAMCSTILEDEYGYLPPGTIEVKSHLDERFNVMVYSAYYLP